MLSVCVRSTYSLNEMIYKSAEYHYKQGDKGQMLYALEQLDQWEARVEFLHKRGLFDEAVTMLKEEGKLLEAAKILREQVRTIIRLWVSWPHPLTPSEAV